MSEQKPLTIAPKACICGPTDTCLKPKLNVGYVCKIAAFEDLRNAYADERKAHAETREQLIDAQRQSRLDGEAYLLLANEIRETREQLAQARKDTERLAFYFNSRGESRPQELLDLEFRCVSDGADSVPLEEWISAIDKGIDAAMGALRAKPEAKEKGPEVVK